MDYFFNLITYSYITFFYLMFLISMLIVIGGLFMGELLDLPSGGVVLVILMIILVYTIIGSFNTHTYHKQYTLDEINTKVVNDFKHNRVAIKIPSNSYLIVNIADVKKIKVNELIKKIDINKDKYYFISVTDAVFIDNNDIK